MSPDRIGLVDLAKRIQWILDNRRDPSTGELWEAKALGEAAGLKSTAHVGLMKRGTVKAPTGETMAAIARAANVSLWWLIMGEGGPDDEDRAHSTTDSSVPIARNIPGWGDTLKIDRMTAASSPADRHITDDAWQRSDHAARYLIQGPAAPGDALRIARLAMEVADPKRFDTAYAANRRTLEATRAEDEEEAAAFHTEVDQREGRAPRGQLPKRTTSTKRARKKS